MALKRKSPPPVSDSTIAQRAKIAEAKREERAAEKSAEKFGKLVDCQWFARCDRFAVTTVQHPVLGDVPCCERCAKFAQS